MDGTDEEDSFPADSTQITPALLTRLLGREHAGVAVRSVDVVAEKRCGEGIASTADRVTLDLGYATAPDRLPTRMVLKTMLATPHAPQAMYENEVRFYREVRPEIDIEAPHSFATHFDPRSGRFGILMEDLSKRGARFPDALTDISTGEVRSLLSSLARLHASYWRSPRFQVDLAWLPTPTSGGMYDVFSTIGLELIADQVARNDFKQELLAPVGRPLEDLWDLLWVAQRTMSKDPTTLLHGDPHIANTYLLSDDRGGFLDWQLMVRGSWAHDVTYLMATSLPTDQRRAIERELVAEYLELLASHGVADVPSEEAAWERIRVAALWGLVIGWLITPPQNYGVEITEANLQRVVAVVRDYDTVEAIARIA